MDNSEAIETSEDTVQPKKWNPWYSGTPENIFQELRLISDTLELVFTDDLFQDIDSLLRQRSISALWSHIAIIGATLLSIAEYFSKCIPEAVFECDQKLSSIVFHKLEKTMLKAAHSNFTADIMGAETAINDIIQGYHAIKGVVRNTDMMQLSLAQGTLGGILEEKDLPKCLSDQEIEQQMEKLAYRLKHNYVGKGWRAK